MMCPLGFWLLNTHTHGGFRVALYRSELSRDLPGPVSDSHEGRVETLCNDTVP